MLPGNFGEVWADRPVKAIEMLSRPKSWDEIALRGVCLVGRPVQREVAAGCREVSACGDKPQAVPVETGEMNEGAAKSAYI